MVITEHLDDDYCRSLGSCVGGCYRQASQARLRSFIHPFSQPVVGILASYTSKLAGKPELVRQFALGDSKCLQ